MFPNGRRFWLIFEAVGVAGVAGPGDALLDTVCADIESLGKGVQGRI